MFSELLWESSSLTKIMVGHLQIVYGNYLLLFFYPSNYEHVRDFQYFSKVFLRKGLYLNHYPLVEFGLMRSLRLELQFNTGIQSWILILIFGSKKWFWRRFRTI